MSGEKDLEQLKKEAAAKAKAAALAKQKANEQAGARAETTTKVATSPDDEKAKAKALAVAKAKAAAAAKAKASAQAGTVAGELTVEGDEKAKAIAAAKAKAAAAAKAKATVGAEASSESALSGEDKKAQAIAAAKAKAAAAAKAKTIAGAKAGEASVVAEVVKPSANQPFLDKYVRVIEEHLGKDVLEDAYINKLSKDVPTLVAKCETYFKVAQFLKYNELLGFDYASELHGTDFETHMEVYVHLYSYKNHQSVALKTKIDRNKPELESLCPLWAGVNWAECEAYDLLGIKFHGHPNLHRIMLGEEWIGHPLRKDYEPYDVEV
jgi:NADH-quinone oxidoreductase subunit C